jgi:hypothetical protein
MKKTFVFNNPLFVGFLLFMLILNGCKKEKEEDLANRFVGAYSGGHIFYIGFADLDLHRAFVTIETVGKNKVSVSEVIIGEDDDIPPYVSIKFTADVEYNSNNQVTLKADIPGGYITGSLEHGKLDIGYFWTSGNVDRFRVP